MQKKKGKAGRSGWCDDFVLGPVGLKWRGRGRKKELADAKLQEVKGTGRRLGGRMPE